MNPVLPVDHEIIWLVTTTAMASALGVATGSLVTEIIKRIRQNNE